MTPEQYLEALRNQAQEEYEDKFDAHENLKYCAAKMVAFNCRDKNAEFDADELESVAEQPYILRALDDMTDKELKAIVGTGNTKKAEEMIRKESAKNGFVPEKSFQGLAPNAKEFTEGVQDKIGRKGFLNDGTEEQIEVYEQLLAARASVNAVRNSFRARSLNKPVDLDAYHDTLKQMDNDGTIPDALSNLIEKFGEKKVQEWARTGHGGLLEDKVKEEVREMAKTGEYKLGDVPGHFRPTVGQRMEDIREVMSSDEKWNGMTPEEKKFMISEYALLQKQSRGPNGMNSVMGDIAEHNEKAEAFAKSEKFNASVKNVDDVRRHLTNLSMEAVTEAFEKTHAEEKQKAQQEEEKMAGELEKEFDKNYGQGEKKQDGPAGPVNSIN